MTISQAELEISRSAALHNFSCFKKLLKPDTKMLVLVKSNSYGHGGVEFAKLMAEAGADYFGVATLDEGINLRKAGFTTPILTLSAGDGCFPEIVEYKLEPGIPTVEYLKSLIATLRSLGIKHYPIHIKFDTGMHRLGFEQKDTTELIKCLKGCDDVDVVSCYSHLAASDEPQHDEFTLGQIALFTKLCDELESVLPHRPMRHILNSAGIERFAQYQMDMVRLGVGVYGISATGSTDLKPAAALKCPILQIKTLTEGTVGYGRKGTLHRDSTTTATIRIGYGDGISRHLGCGHAKFMVNGRPAPTIGNICMDMCMLDITGIDAKVGDTVTIFGEKPTVCELAEILDTIPYEVFTGIDHRLKRVIVD